ncbi:GntR family transcriptional regulator [Consotaella aegiceratis]|uniref:GntR family transcriptional regulator n=1 Tax=Consotaella aegiceratis TaxID=3097961 RepID=UPI002F4008FA
MSRVDSGIPQIPVRRVTTATAIYEQLHQAIVGMALRPGESLHEKTLTQRFGVSRTPVREALLTLAKDGLVDLIPQSGTFVARIPVGALAEASVIRVSLERTTVERTAAVAVPDDIARIDGILGRQRLAADHGETSGFHKADEAFHEAIALIAGYPNIWRLLRQVKVQIDRARLLTLPVEGRMHQVIEEHERIREAIARNDIDGSRTAMESHLNALAPNVDRLRTQYPDYFI